MDNINQICNTVNGVEGGWNNFMQSTNGPAIGRMMSQCGVSNPNGLVGKRVYTAGWTGLGSFPGTIKQVDMSVGELLIHYDDGDRKWKTGRLCWM